MRLTLRDIRLVRDVALSHVLSRDQILSLGYFRSVTRANTRLRGLVNLRLLNRLETPFYGQSLYTIAPNAREVVGQRIAPIAEARAGSPRYLQHALMVTNARIALQELGAAEWRFEPQLHVTFSVGGREFQVRPDGMALFARQEPLAIEVDLGHVNHDKYALKLRAFDRFIASGQIKRMWDLSSLRLLTLTTGDLRAKHLARLTPPGCSFEHRVETFSAFGLKHVGSWS